MKVTLTKEEAFTLLSEFLPKELVGGHKITAMNQNYSGDVEIFLTKKAADVIEAVNTAYALDAVYQAMSLLNKEEIGHVKA